MCQPNRCQFVANPVRGRLNAMFFTAFDGYINRLLAAQKRDLFRDLPGQVVEIGAGVGANFRYFPNGARVTAVEPNLHMHDPLCRRAGDFGIELDLVPAGAEAIPLPDDSAEAVISTLVLCTVDDPEQALGEVRRILKPGGRFLFVEHVAAPHGHWRRVLQDVLHRPWRYIFEGCHTNRDTAAYIEAAGFRELSLETHVMQSPFVPENSQISGVAVA